MDDKDKNIKHEILEELKELSLNEIENLLKKED